MRITIENGHIYDLSDLAVARLQACDNAQQVGWAFEGFAPDVPPRDRLAVWMEV